MLTWPKLRALGVGFWLTDAAALRSTAEALARAQYAASKDPHAPALLYAALGKKAVLMGLFRSIGNKKVGGDGAGGVKGGEGTNLPLSKGERERGGGGGSRRDPAEGEVCVGGGGGGGGCCGMAMPCECLCVCICAVCGSREGGGEGEGRKTSKWVFEWLINGLFWRLFGVRSVIHTEVLVNVSKQQAGRRAMLLPLGILRPSACGVWVRNIVACAVLCCTVSCRRCNSAS